MAPAGNVETTRRIDRRAADIFLMYLSELALADWVAAARRRSRLPSRRAAEHTALAVLLHAGLTPEEFEILYQPFEDAIPRALVAGLPR